MRSLCLTACFAVLVADAQTDWTLASGYSPSSFQTQNILAFARDVQALSQGSLRIDVQSVGSLVKLPDIPQAGKEGKVAAGETILINLVADMPITGAEAIPLTYNQTTTRIAEKLGACPVSVAMADVNQALASGKVDAMITSAVTDVDNRA
jgi:TRAP-type C4-dicarboxylate transport system substrate-binding protein